MPECNNFNFGYQSGIMLMPVGNLLSTIKKSAMITVKVTYKVNDAYVSINLERIQNFLADFKRLDPAQFVYTVFQGTDSNTFIHISQYKNKEIQETLLNTPSFLYFQQQRDKNLVTEPVIEVLNHIGSSKDVFET